MNRWITFYLLSSFFVFLYCCRCYELKSTDFFNLKSFGILLLICWISKNLSSTEYNFLGILSLLGKLHANFTKSILLIFIVIIYFYYMSVAFKEITTHCTLFKLKNNFNNFFKKLSAFQVIFSPSFINLCMFSLLFILFIQFVYHGRFLKIIYEVILFWNLHSTVQYLGFIVFFHLCTAFFINIYS